MKTGQQLVQLAAYSNLFERLLDSMFLVAENTWTILAANPSAERELGIEISKLEGSSLFTLVHPKDIESFEKYLRVASRRYYPIRFEACFKTAAGKTPTMEVLAGQLNFSDGTQGLQLICRDVTYQREIERKLLENSTKDELTLLWNRRYFNTEAEREHKRASRYGTPYSIVLLDVDHFKNYNDQNGHPAGDQLLKNLSELLRKACRATDIAARYGGEEFIILCPNTPPENALVLARRIVDMVRAHDFPNGENQPLRRVTASLGVAGYPRNGASLQDVIARADEALYQSKNNGRDQVTLSK